MTDGIARAGWDLDLKHGESREIRLATIMNMGQSKVEVKSDGIARRTGRIYVEFEHKGNPSGLAVTTADHWAFEINDDIWIIVPTQRLRDLAARAYNDGLHTAGGDHNTTRGVTIPLDWFYRGA